MEDSIGSRKELKRISKEDRCQLQLLKLSKCPVRCRACVSSSYSVCVPCGCRLKLLLVPFSPALRTPPQTALGRLEWLSRALIGQKFNIQLMGYFHWPNCLFADYFFLFMHVNLAKPGQINDIDGSATVRQPAGFKMYLGDEQRASDLRST